MKNRIVRWTIYFVVGVAIGVGVNYYNKQNNIDEGVVALSPDAVQEDIAIPSRFRAPMENTPETIGAMAKEIEEAGEAVMEETSEAVQEKAEEVMENLKEMMPSTETPEATEVVEELMPSEEMIDEGMAKTTDAVAEDVAKDAVKVAPADMEEHAPKVMEEMPKAAPEHAPVITPMPQ